VNCAEQLGLQNVFALLVFFSSLVRLIVLPSDCIVALPAIDVPHDMPACCHAAFRGIVEIDIDNVAEQIRFAMLATKVLATNILATCIVLVA
jgi:hypothetical protein